MRRDKSMSNYINDEVIWMLKNGRSAEEIRSVLGTEAKKSYSYEFVDFMQEMLDKYQIKRTEIESRAWYLFIVY